MLTSHPARSGPLPRADQRSAAAEIPVISVIIPARNEGAGIADCLQSLVAQQGIAFEIIVVDDASTDRTRAIAESFANVQVYTSGPLPDAWSGKCNACITGVQFARGDWMLFTDADTIHKPGSLARSVAEACEHNADLLSYSPEQEVQGLAERALMPVVFSDLARVYRPKDVCNPSSPTAAANGQYLLIRRRAYDAIGGHAAVAGEILEDVALARRVKQSGRRIRFRYGDDAVRTRMYRNFTQMREGWTKNLALLFPSPGVLAAKRAAEFVVSAGAFTTAIAAFKYGANRLGMVAAVVAVPT